MIHKEKQPNKLQHMDQKEAQEFTIQLQIQAYLLQ